ncbi:MAG: hypothetical protein P8J74_01555 [Woeseiaceae bacterium]|nr:hypothetical protein [Woeseiaceae bacterium]
MNKAKSILKIINCVSLDMKYIILLLVLSLSMPAFAHVSLSSQTVHQVEHLIWALVIILITWMAFPALKKIKQKIKSG